MTRASHARIATRAAKHEFRPPPEGMLSERIDLDAFHLTLGLVHPEGAPMMIAVWNGERMQYLLPEQAMAWADELVKAGQAVQLAPVVEAIRKLVKRVGEIVSATVMRQFAEAGVQGHA